MGEEEKEGEWKLKEAKKEKDRERLHQQQCSAELGWCPEQGKHVVHVWRKKREQPRSALENMNNIKKRQDTLRTHNKWKIEKQRCAKRQEAEAELKRQKHENALLDVAVL